MIILDGVQLAGFELPESLAFGGAQTLVTHKMIGGSRVIDSMGPDDEPISWSGRFLDEFAAEKVFRFDLLRRSGREVTLQVPAASRAYRVVVSRFIAKMERPYLYSYDISCEITEDLVAGTGGKDSRSLEQEVQASIAACEAYAATRDDILLTIALVRTAVLAAMGNKGARRVLGSMALSKAQGLVGQAVFDASGSASAANLAVGAVTGVGGVIAGGDPKAMAENFLTTTVAVEAASNLGLAAAHMTGVGTALAA